MRDEGHPAERWRKEAQHPYQETQLQQLRLAAMAGHLQVDQVAARRAALIDLLADGRPHLREEIWETVTAQVGRGCWGKRPAETLQRDLKVLRRGGVQIAYSRRRGVEGYYLEYPALQRPPTPQYDAINWDYVEQIRRLSVAEKNRLAFAAADFALRQKRLLLAEEHPEWPSERVEKEARRLVYGGR